MPKVLIVGAGQAGLQLGLGLRSEDYDVTIMSARTPDEIRSGWVMSTQCMYGPALQHERDDDLNRWEQQTPKIEGIGYSRGDSARERALDWAATLDAFGQSVDQRIKMAGWLELFEERGGKAVYHGVTTSDIDALTMFYDLVIIAAGKGELVELFDRDPSRSPYTSTQRTLAAVYVHGMAPRAEHPPRAMRFNALPGLGEVLVMASFTSSGPCDIILIEGLPGGPLDRWQDRPQPAEHLARTLELLREYVPWEYELCGHVKLTDGRATLSGGYPPVVRHPVARLPSGGQVLGMADVVVANDPITTQGSNLASKCAASYLASILERGDRPLDATWMRQAFGRYWSDAQHASAWTNMMLAPLPEHAMDLLRAAADHPQIARRFANGFADPSDFQYWLLDEEKAQSYLASVIRSAG